MSSTPDARESRSKSTSNLAQRVSDLKGVYTGLLMGAINSFNEEDRTDLIEGVKGAVNIVTTDLRLRRDSRGLNSIMPPSDDELADLER